MYTACTRDCVNAHARAHTGTPVTIDRCFHRTTRLLRGWRGGGGGYTPPGWTNGEGRGEGGMEVRPGNKACNRNVNYIKINREIGLIEIVLRRRRTIGAVMRNPIFQVGSR